MHTWRVAVVAALLAGCGGEAPSPAGQGAAPAPASGGGTAVPPGTPDQRDAGGMDIAKAMVDTPAPYKIQLHTGAEIGQWAEWEMAGTSMWWGVTATHGDLLLVENRMQMGDAWVSQGFLVDAEGNVQRAFVANYYADGIPDVGYERKIMKKLDAEGREPPDLTTGTGNVNAAGRDWACKWTAVDVSGKIAKSWMADDAWFSKLIKSEYDGDVTMMLKEIGTDAKPGMRIPK